MPLPRYRSNDKVESDLNYFVVFCTKYKRPVLIRGIETRLEELIKEKAVELGVEVKSVDVWFDTVYLSISTPPSDALQHYVNQIKRYTAHTLRLEFPELVSKLPSLWTRSYFAASEGTVSPESVDRYLINQKWQ